MFTGAMTWRELGVMIRRLPMESATKTVLRDMVTDVPEYIETDAPDGPWSKQELLIATVADLISALIFVQLQRAGVKDATLPQPIKRPGIRARARVDPRSVTYLAEIRRRNAEARGAG